MKNEQDSTDLARLEPPLETAVKAVLAGPIPEDAIKRVKAKAKQMAAPAASASRSLNQRPGRKTSRSLIIAISAAAALLILVTAGFLFMNYSEGRAFAQMVDKVKAARTVRFTIAHRFGKEPEITAVTYLEGDLVRVEHFDGSFVEVGDLDRKQGLFLDMRRKLAQPIEIGADEAREFANPIEQLRRATADRAEQIGEEILAGRHTQVYRVNKVDLLGIRGRGDMLVWVDVACGLPAKIVIRDRDPKFPVEFRFEEFRWNEPLDHRLFSLSIPDGFQTRVVVKMPSPRKPPQTTRASAENPGYLTDGVLSGDRVPRRILWGPRGDTITTLLRDPESMQGILSQENELRQWDVTTGKLRWSAKVGGADWLAGTADGKTLATVIGYEVQLRDAASGKTTRTWATEEPLSPLAFSPDGKTLAAGISEWGRFDGRGGRESGGVQFWNIEEASLLRSISDDKPTTLVRYSPDGKHMVTYSNGGSMKLWDVTTGEMTRIFPGIHQADFSPDGQTIACQPSPSSADKTIGRVDLYRVRDGSLVKSFTSEKGASASWLCCIAFSPDGHLLAAADWNGAVTLWDVASGERRRTSVDHKAGVLSVAFAPNSAMFATGSEDRTLRVHKVPAQLVQQSPKKR